MLSRPRWLDYIDNPVFDIRNFDVISDDIAALPGSGEVNLVIHMASIASPTFYRKYPVETIDANIWGLRKLLDLYSDKNVKGLLFFSSSEIYGNPSPDMIPTNEEYHGLVSCTGPRACYDESKRFGETMCSLFARKYSMPIGVVRPFNNYGPGMRLDDKRVPADFAKNVREGKDIVILSSGQPTRTFCYVADAIIGYFKVLLHGKYDYFNIGMDVPEITITKLAEIYRDAGREVFGHAVGVVKGSSADTEYLTHNPARRCPDLTKARRMLGYAPSITVVDGVHRFLRHIKETNQGDYS
jgi:UDP-glucuronate decarboxylase